ncbi:MAG: glycosyltransferase family 4 protein [Chloroflexi bacterium]|nr:glycosyltransferase family 4 protein [Chloroflexota bacterium]
MKPSILIVSPLHPPARGGVADHTQRLAQEWSAQANVSILTSFETTGAATPRICPLIRDWSDAPELLRILSETTAQPAILWQYVPHMYGRGGVNPALPRVMAALRKQGRRQIVIAHEIAAPFSPWPHRFWYALAHRRQWRRILQEADVIGISTEAWLEEWTRRTPQFREKFRLLPSPSSIPIAAVASDHRQTWRRRQDLPAAARMLLYFGSLNPSKRLSGVLTAWRQAQSADAPVALVIVGDHPKESVPRGLSHLFRALGYLPAEQVSAALQAADVLALPFIDGVSERRTSFMAGLNHGCAIVTTVGHNTGPILRQADFFAVPTKPERGAFAARVAGLLGDEAQRFQLGRRAQTAYERSYSWPVLISRLAACA